MIRLLHQATSAHPEKSTFMLRVGVIGYGYWGPNIVRNFHAQDDSRVVMVCDKSPDALKRVN
jgi:predicted dehydrogenase